MENKDTRNVENLEQTLIDMAIEGWRFSRTFTRLLSRLDAGEGERYVNQVRFFQKKMEDSLETNGMRLVNVDGQMFDPGMAVSALNIGDFGPEDELVVEQTVEPIIMGIDGLKRPGTVMLRKAHK